MIRLNLMEIKIRNSATLQGIIHRVECTLIMDNESMFRGFILPAPDPSTFIPLEQVTDSQIKKWLKPQVADQKDQMISQAYAKEKQKKNLAVKVANTQTGKIEYTRNEDMVEWAPGIEFKKDDPFFYKWEEEVDGETVSHIERYHVVQPHTSQANWLPNENPALYTSAFIFEGEFPKWKKPTGAHDVYPLYFEVEKKGVAYKSKIANNDTDPETSPQFWEVISEEENNNEIEPWVSYDGTPNTMWDIGEMVTHNGKTWESNVDNNVWEPPQQWTEVIG